MERELLIKNLSEIIGNENVLTDENIVLEATKDYIGFRRHERAEGVYNVNRASCVVKVNSTEEISKVLKFLNDNEIDVVPRTGGSSVTLGIEPVPGGVILDASGMNEIVNFDEVNSMVTVKCGTPLEYLENWLNERGYTTGHMPQSLPMAQMGGLVATRSIGQWSTLYGGIEDLLVGLEAVLPNGEVVRIKNVPRRSTGPDLRHLFIGCEGTLGFITEVTVKVFKYRPENRWMCAYEIDNTPVGLEAIREIMVEGYRPAVVRLHDALEVKYFFNGCTSEGKSLLIFLCEGPKAICEATGAGIDAIVKKHGGVSLGEKPVQAWLVHRNDVSYDIDGKEQQIYKMGLIADTCEISANWSDIGEIYKAVLTRLPKDVPNCALIGGHSSHSYLTGTNIYFQFGIVARGKGTAEQDYMSVIKVIMEETLKRGGSIAHHHGSGKYRTKWMPEEHGTSYPLMYKLKDALDPKHIMNKGVILVDKD